MTNAWPAASFEDAARRLTAPGAPFEMTDLQIDGRSTRVFKASPATLTECFAAGRCHGSLTFLVNGDERVSFEAFSRATLVLAGHLRASGLRKGERVAIAMRNLPEWPVAFFATVLAGGVAAPLNAWWAGEELRFALHDCGARVLIADTERYDRLIGGPLPDTLETVFVARGEAAHVGRRLEEIIGRPEAWRDLPEALFVPEGLQGEDDATLFYTSGTGGRPKGVIGTHRNAGTNIMALAWSAAVAALRAGAEGPGPSQKPQPSSLVSIPFFHATGCLSVLVGALAMGGKLVLTHRFDAAEALELIERERVTTAGGVPSIAWELLREAARTSHDLSSLEAVAFGGAPAAPQLVSRILSETPAARPATGWGMTETSAVTLHHMGEDYVRRPESCGRLIPVCEARIVDAAGRDVPVGEAGELWVRGPNIARGYWNRPEDTAATFVDGWVRTGDVARADAEGFYTIVDRVKDIIIRGGENISSVEVENLLFSHPIVVDVAVVGVPDEVLGEIPAAAVVVADGASFDPEDLRRYCTGRLAAFKVPARFLQVQGSLPRNAAGKVVKPQVRALFEAC